ncbi:MAG: hypothetical protein IKP65_09195, partial [Alphaproteobacteria bacterium]|nr:hypothetical protein [Alphaproteobacteria bacterium]
RILSFSLALVAIITSFCVSNIDSKSDICPYGSNENIGKTDKNKHSFRAYCCFHSTHSFYYNDTKQIQHLL